MLTEFSSGAGKLLIGINVNKFLYQLTSLSKKIWFTCCLYCLFAVFSFFAGSFFGDFIPEDIKKIVTADGVKDILKIIASSMLAVTIFSLSIMVQAFNIASTTASPRADKLLMQDSTARNALGSFIGSFLFSIVGIIGINSKIYDQDIIAILFMFTIIMIVVIIVMLLQWINQLFRLGRVSSTIDLVENALNQSIIQRSKQPFLFAHEMKKADEDLDKNFHPIISSSFLGRNWYINNSIARACGFG